MKQWLIVRARRARRRGIQYALCLLGRCVGLRCGRAERNKAWGVEDLRSEDRSREGKLDMPAGTIAGQMPLCNDMVVAAERTVYITDSLSGRILRLKKRASALETSATERHSDLKGPQLDGVACWPTAISTPTSSRATAYIASKLRPTAALAPSPSLDVAQALSPTVSPVWAAICSWLKVERSEHSISSPSPATLRRSRREGGALTAKSHWFRWATSPMSLMIHYVSVDPELSENLDRGSCSSSEAAGHQMTPTSLLGLPIDVFGGRPAARESTACSSEHRSLPTIRRGDGVSCVVRGA